MICCLSSPFPNDMWSNLFSDRHAREKWEAALVWWRLRYETAVKPTHCLNLLSRSQACGRLALYHQPSNPLSYLYIGLPPSYERLLQQMAADFHLSLQPVTEAFTRPTLAPLTAVSALSWHEPFLAHLVDGVVFASLSRQKQKGRYLPKPTAGTPASPWQLPDPPPPGLAIRPTWPEQSPPAHLIVNDEAAPSWPLGRTKGGVALGVSGRVNIYGRRQAVADWLVQQVSQIISVRPTQLVVLDGAGDLVPKLKRKTAVTRLLGEQLTYVDMDGASLTSGFNPLAPVPGETSEAQVQRWQQWFGEMNVQPQALHLLPQAYQNGVGDIPGLRKWLKQIERKGQYTAAASLNLALNRLTANRLMREWLEWPANRFETLPEGVLFFSCQNTGWDRRQVLRAVLLGVLSLQDVHLVAHGLGALWRCFFDTHNSLPNSVILSNGPVLPKTTTILVQIQQSHIPILAPQFLGNDSHMIENLQLLKPKEGLLIHEKEYFFVRWPL
ncbi:MAG: hypothetical protein H6658_09950 [Ardenticatenaceae bacterium]|nr:hypothetical protein [Ardenticatenaceae bacterium]